MIRALIARQETREEIMSHYAAGARAVSGRGYGFKYEVTEGG